MNQFNHPASPKRCGRSLTALALVAMLGSAALAPQVAYADRRHDDHGRYHDHGHYRGHRGYRHDGYYRHDDRRYWGGPGVVYAPQPSPGISLFVPIR